jgi:predicted GNAT family acetyltransferase
MADDLIVEHEDLGARGRYFIRLADGTEGEMTYRKVRDGVVAIDHTYVPDQHRGQGIAEKLVKVGVGDIKAQNLKIIPLCWYVAAQFRRHPEWEDLRAA